MIEKAHEDAVKGLVFFAETDTIISGGLDKQVIFWSLEQQENRDIFTQVDPVIEEIEEEGGNTANLLNRPSNGDQNSGNPRVNYTLVKSEKMTIDRVIEMNQPQQRNDICFFLIADNKSVHKMRISSKEVARDYVKENQDIMTFCVNDAGTLLITSMIGSLPCFHLWMIDNTRYTGNNAFQMFSKRSFHWKTGRRC